MLDRENEIKAWLPRFGERRRDTIEGEEVRQQVVSWEAEGLAASTINHRLSALSQLFEVLDGNKAYNPVREIPRLREPTAKPDGRSPETIQKVFAALEARVKRQNRGWRTLARLKVIALTGMRHSDATALRAQGMDLADVQELMGHKSARTTRRYAMVAPKKLAAAADLLHQAWHPTASPSAAQAKPSKTGTDK